MRENPIFPCSFLSSNPIDDEPVINLKKKKSFYTRKRKNGKREYLSIGCVVLIIFKPAVTSYFKAESLVDSLLPNEHHRNLAIFLFSLTLFVAFIKFAQAGLNKGVDVYDRMHRGRKEEKDDRSDPYYILRYLFFIFIALGNGFGVAMSNVYSGWRAFPEFSNKGRIFITLLVLAGSMVTVFQFATPPIRKAVIKQVKSDQENLDEKEDCSLLKKCSRPFYLSILFIGAVSSSIFGIFSTDKAMQYFLGLKEGIGFKIALFAGASMIITSILLAFRKESTKYKNCNPYKLNIPMILGWICWIVAGVIAAAGTYIGLEGLAKHYAFFNFSTTIKLLIILASFVYQLQYSGLTLVKKVIYCFDKIFGKPEPEKGIEMTSFLSSR